MTKPVELLLYSWSVAFEREGDSLLILIPLISPLMYCTYAKNI